MGGLCAAGAGVATAQEQPTAPAAVEAAPNYPQSPEGFAAQFMAVLEAYQRGDSAAGKVLLEQTRLPHSAEWIAEHIGPEHGDELAARYDRLFQSYVDHADQTLQEIVKKKVKWSPKLQPGRALPVDGFSPQSTLKSTGIVPVKEQPYFNGNFFIDLTPKSHVFLTGEYRSRSWLDVFVYTDGAWRFVGHGAWPFWMVEPKVEPTVQKGPAVPEPLDFGAEVVDEVIPFEMQKVTAALEIAMANEDCKVTKETEGHIECKRTREYANSQHGASGGESVTAVVEAQGDKTHVRISTGKGFYGRMVKSNWSVAIYEEMVKTLRKTEPEN